MKKFTLNSLALLAALVSTGALAQAVIPSSALPPRSPGAPAPAPGLYVSVLDGQISLSNKGGTSNFTAGQFGYTASPVQPPVIVPVNPGLKFTPPVQFVKPASTPAGATTVAGRSNAVDCVVR